MARLPPAYGADIASTIATTRSSITARASAAGLAVIGVGAGTANRPDPAC